MSVWRTVFISPSLLETLEPTEKYQKRPPAAPASETETYTDVLDASQGRGKEAASSNEIRKKIKRFRIGII